MASSTTLFCDEYHCSAGSVLFRFDTKPSPQICILRNRKSSEFVLPKGHKDLGESLEQAAIRETYEETGWPCVFLPTNILTRVPPPGVSSGDTPREALAATSEAIAVTVRQLDGSPKNVKFVWWYITQISSTQQHQDTQMASEDLEALWLNFDDAVRRLSRPSDRDVAARAVELVRKTQTAQGLKPMIT
ncbi:hypothetical protein FRB99_008733 [Tulasnella sp. 403]|nr:hypothetical protein FRB99_008733 [Tulasnella sp. 403]